VGVRRWLSEGAIGVSGCIELMQCLGCTVLRQGAFFEGVWALGLYCLVWDVKGCVPGI